MRLHSEFWFTCPCSIAHMRETSEPFKCECGRLQVIEWGKTIVLDEEGWREIAVEGGK